MKNLNKNDPLKGMKMNKAKRRYWTAAGAAVLCLCCVTPAMAAGDPLDIVNNLSDFIFSIIKALGVIILGWGIVQVGMSIQSHDASQRTQGFLCLFGGLLIAFAKESASVACRNKSAHGLVMNPVRGRTAVQRCNRRKLRTVIAQFIRRGNPKGSVAYWESRKLGKSSTHD